MKMFYIQTYGCQMNVADSDLMTAHLTRLGMRAATDLASADFIILNTCSVRQHAEHRALSFIGRLPPYKRKNPYLKVIVAGCTAQKEGETLRRKFPVVDLVVGAKDIEHFPEIFDRSFSPDAVTAADCRAKPGMVTALVTIMRGCGNFCSYCIVPFVRGPEISRPADEIAVEVQELAARGIREVTLLGQNVNSYFDRGTDFPYLLALLQGISGIERIRFMTSHPKDLSERLIDAMAELPGVCEHLHLPLQSGSDRMLSAMNRRYTTDRYLTLIEKLRKKIPGVSMTTDILVGFPGETDEDFDATLGLVNTVEFDYIFAFKYSPRPGTTAALLDDNVPAALKAERHARILDAVNGITSRKNARLLGTIAEVLVEGRQNGRCTGRTRTNKKVFFDANGDLAGRLVRVKISDSRLNSLTGIIEERSEVHHA